MAQKRTIVTLWEAANGLTLVGRGLAGLRKVRTFSRPVYLIELCSIALTKQIERTAFQLQLN